VMSVVGVSVNAGALIGGAGFSHGLSVEFEPVGVVNEAVEGGGPPQVARRRRRRRWVRR